MRVAIAIGSNLGNRLEHLQFAVDKLAEHVRITGISSVYSTAPVGGPDQDDYLNAVIIGETEMEPQALLNFGHTVEADAHRVRKEYWGPRTLDVDLLVVDNQQISTETLTLPHPRAHERGFVLVPWNEIDPSFELVGHGRIRDLVNEVDVTGVDLAPQFILNVPGGNSDVH